MLRSKRDLDKGWAWVVLGVSFLSILLTSGISFVSGIFQKLFLEEFQESVAFTAWVTSLFSSFMQLAGPLSGILVSSTSCRTTVMVGGALLTLGLAASSFAKSMSFLFVTFGLCGGIGLGLLYTPSIVVVNLFFDRRRTVITGVAMSAGGVGIIGAPVLSRYLIDHFTWQEALLVLACLAAQTCIFGALMFPIHEPTTKCVQLYHRCLKRHRKNNSDLIQVQYKEVHEIALSDQCKEENEDETRNEERLERQHSKVNLNFNSLPHSSEFEDGDIAMQLQEEHLATNCGYPVQRPDAHFLEQEGLNDGCTKHENGESVLLSDTESKEDEASPLVQNFVSIDGTTVKSPTNTNNIESRESITEAHLVNRKAATQDVTTADCHSVSPFSSIHNLEGAGLQSTFSGSKTSVCPEASGENKSNLAVFKNIPFIMLCVNLFLANAACGIFNIHLPAFSEQRGINDQTVAFILALDGVAVFLSRILLGALGHDEKVDQLAVYFGLHVISAFIQTMLSFANSVASVVAMVMLMGIYYGSVYTLLSPLTIALVGLQKLAFAFGVEMISAGFGYLVAPPLAGWVVDKTGNYNNSMYLGGFLMFLSAIAVLFISCVRKPRVPLMEYNLPEKACTIDIKDRDQDKEK